MPLLATRPIEELITTMDMAGRNAVGDPADVSGIERHDVWTEPVTFRLERGTSSESGSATRLVACASGEAWDRG